MSTSGNFSVAFRKLHLWKVFSSILLGAICLTGTPGRSAFATDQALPQSFLFVSANTREHMSDEAAWESLNSFEQRNFLAVENYLASRLCSKPRVMSSEGMDGGTTENSSLVTGCNAGPARYLGELLARYAHQKWILIFVPASSGSERLVMASFSAEHPEDTPRLLRQHGFSAGTIIAQDKTVMVYLWARDHSQDAAVNAFVQAVHATLREIRGKAILIGNDSRSAAQDIFDRQIQAYEHAHHQSFSGLLWSRRLHDLGTDGSL
jgi:hypothetical protein